MKAPYGTPRSRVKIIIIVLLEVGRLHIYLRKIDGRQPLERLQALRTCNIYTVVRRRRFVGIAFYIFIDGARDVRRDDTRLGDGRGEDLVALGRGVVVVAFLLSGLRAHTLR